MPKPKKTTGVLSLEVSLPKSPKPDYYVQAAVYLNPKRKDDPITLQEILTHVNTALDEDNMLDPRIDEIVALGVTVVEPPPLTIKIEPPKDCFHDVINYSMNDGGFYCADCACEMGPAYSKVALELIALKRNHE